MLTTVVLWAEARAARAGMRRVENCILSGLIERLEQ